MTNTPLNPHQLPPQLTFSDILEWYNATQTHIYNTRARYDTFQPTTTRADLEPLRPQDLAIGHQSGHRQTTYETQVIFAYFLGVLTLQETLEYLPWIYAAFNIPLLEQARLGPLQSPYNSDNESIPDSESGTEATDVPKGLECTLCDREISVQFRSCAHAACKSCTKKIWWVRWEVDSWPSGFQCPWCRTEVSEVGRLLTQSSQGDKVVHGETEFMVSGWCEVRAWMLTESAEARSRLNALGPESTREVPAWEKAWYDLRK